MYLQSCRVVVLYTYRESCDHRKQRDAPVEVFSSLDVCALEVFLLYRRL